MKTLNTVSPDIEIFSIDEAFLDLTYCQKIYSTPMEIGWVIREKIFKISRLSCSVGISGDKSTAKFATKMHKPDGITIIKPTSSRKVLSKYPVTSLCGVSTAIKSFLNHHHVFKCGDMKNIAVSILGNRYGNIGRRIWLMAQGKDIDCLKLSDHPPKSFGHGKVTKPGTHDYDELKKIFHHMSEKVAKRMRINGYESNLFFIGLKTKKSWITNKFKTLNYINHGNDIFKLCTDLLFQAKPCQGIFQVQVTALKPRPIKIQKDLFLQENNKIYMLDKAVDSINQRFGDSTISQARILKKLENPDVISPSWRPDGHKKSL
jgi:DNA polymerase-4